MEEKVKENTKDINYLKFNCSKYERDLAVMNEKIKEINEKIDEIKCNQEKYMLDMQTFFDRLTGRYAAKWVEKAMTALITTFCLAVIYAILREIGLE